jgi:hypothetical protein
MGSPACTLGPHERTVLRRVGVELGHGDNKAVLFAFDAEGAGEMVTKRLMNGIQWNDSSTLKADLRTYLGVQSQKDFAEWIDS